MYLADKHHVPEGKHFVCRGCKFNLEKAKKKLLTYYRYLDIQMYKNYFLDFSFEKSTSRTLQKLGAFLPLPAYDDLGRRIILERVCQLIPVDQIDNHCHFIPWIFFQIMYHDKQAQVLIAGKEQGVFHIHC